MVAGLATIERNLVNAPRNYQKAGSAPMDRNHGQLWSCFNPGVSSGPFGSDHRFGCPGLYNRNDQMQSPGPRLRGLVLRGIVCELLRTHRSLSVLCFTNDLSQCFSLD